MKATYSQSIIALFAGAILALMIKLNSDLAHLSSPLEASWIAHGLGALVALILLPCISRFRVRPVTTNLSKKAPWYAYLGGLPGAFTVVLAAITVNSPLGLAGTLAFALLGQILFSLLVEYYAWFNSIKRPLSWHDLKVISLILSGSLLIILARKIA